MKAELYYYFDQELRFLKDELLRYAAQNPEARAALQINDDGHGYADVERIVHGAAMLNARTQCAINDGNSEIIEGFLNVLYPHFLRPVPAMGIIQFVPEISPFQPKIAVSPRQMLQARGEQSARFRLIHDVTILPIVIEDVFMSGPPFKVKVPNTLISSNKQVSVLSFCVSRADKRGPIQEVAFPDWQTPSSPTAQKPAASPIQSLRLNMVEQRNDTFELYEHIMKHLTGVAFSLPDQSTPFCVSSRSAVRPVGLHPDLERVLPTEGRTFTGYAMLGEYFAFPSRFNGFDLQLPDLSACGTASSFIVSFLFDEQSISLEQRVSTNWLRPNCCPVVNLFQPDTVLQEFDTSSHEFPVIVEPVNAAEPFSSLLDDRLEVFSVDSVELYDSAKAESTALHPIYKNPIDVSASNTYWVRREYTKSIAGEITGSDVYLQTIAQPNTTDFEEESDANLRGDQLQYRIRVTAMNREVPIDGEVRLAFIEPVKGVGQINCIYSLSKAIRPYAPSNELWRIVNHLSLNHGSLIFDKSPTTDSSPEPLRNLLSLYERYEHQRGLNASRQIKAITSLNSEPILERFRMNDSIGQPTFARGNHVQIGIDSSDLPNGKAYLFGSVLAAFLAGFQSINSVLRVTVTIDSKPAFSRLFCGRRPSL